MKRYTNENAVSNTAKGAAIGAAAGSIVPGIGNVAGLAIGAGVGALAGLVSGMKTKEQKVKNLRIGPGNAMAGYSNEDIGKEYSYNDEIIGGDSTGLAKTGKVVLEGLQLASQMDMKKPDTNNIQETIPNEKPKSLWGFPSNENLNDVNNNIDLSNTSKPLFNYLSPEFNNTNTPNIVDMFETEEEVEMDTPIIDKRKYIMPNKVRNSLYVKP